MILSISACEKDHVDVGESQAAGKSSPPLTLEVLSPELRSRLLYGPEGEIRAEANAPALEARNNDLRVDTLVDLFVSQFTSEESLNADLTERGYPLWNVTLLPGEGYGENVFVIPVVKECELKGNLFVFHDNRKPLLTHRMDYYSYDYTDMGYMFGANFMSDEELQALYMVAGGQATSQFVMLGTIDTGAVLFRHYVTEAGGINGELSGRTTTCSILYCEGLETSLPPLFTEPIDPDPSANNGNGSGGGGGGSFPPLLGPSAPGWHNGGYTAAGSRVTIWFIPGKIYTRVSRNFAQCNLPFRAPDRTNQASIGIDRLESRSGNCRWITVPGVEDVSEYTYLGNTILGDDFASDVDGFECKGIAFENEVMGIDFAFSIQNILREIGTDWQMIKCLAENPEFAAAANEALSHFEGLSSCEGDIAKIIEDKILASCGSGGSDEIFAEDLVESLENTSWLDLSELKSDCPCMFDIITTQLIDNSGMCNSLGVFETDNSPGNLSFLVGMPSNSVFPQNQFSIFPDRIAQTGLDFNGNTFIALNPGLCNGEYQKPWQQWNQFTLALIPVHEGHHAQIRAYIASEGGTLGANGDQSRYVELLDLIMTERGCDNGLKYAEHEYFLKDLLFEFASYLKTLDEDREGKTLDDYVWWAGRDLFTKLPHGSSQFFSQCAEQYYGLPTLMSWRQKGLNLLDSNGDGEQDYSPPMPASCQ